MSELTHKFLTQLKNDIAIIAQDTGLAGQKLHQLAQGLAVIEDRDDVPLSIDRDKNRLVIHTKHPAVAHLFNNSQQRRSDLLFFVSSMMSILNREDEEINDEHERIFHARLLKFALEDCQGSWAGAV